jgi:hypothetical protein
MEEEGEEGEEGVQRPLLLISDLGDQVFNPNQIEVVIEDNVPIAINGEQPENRRAIVIRQRAG